MVATTKSEAMAVLRELKKQKAIDDLNLPETQTQEKKERMLFDRFAEKYLDHCHTDKAPNTYIKELSRINCQWLPAFKGKYLDEITPLAIMEWKEKRMKDGISSNTLYNELKVLKTMFSRAIDWKLFDGENPVKKLPQPSRKDVNFLTPEQINQYLKCCSKEYYPIAVTLIFTGVRKGELLQLRWDDIDFKRNMIKIRADSSLKNAKSREIPINSQLLPILKSIKEKSESEWVFAGSDGKSRLTTFDKSHRSARKKAGMPKLTIHNFRHTFASLAIQSGSDVGAVSKLLGHSSIRVTMEIYHHLNPDHARNVIEKLPITLGDESVVSHSDKDQE